ncbi:hypothetical protein E1B28_010782 [Marasmius oreades]|uniref:Uncharacterized protein n=1 Tax=Marasmius oreades TaxID=181124 RepID=A0A9P7UNV4_9AGAR|nr:uncharacterized protein E1B28_010782 [Marasmius oreades]KAG7089072.1 hypothetical protein E1B28_010782 [Marasmius oreades]
MEEFKLLSCGIDNKYGQDLGAGYHEDLEAIYRNKGYWFGDSLTYNDPGMGRSFIHGTGLYHPSRPIQWD